ncbi:MAG: hypothetical protein M1820_009022 [Bogoriella megaspora]|nr:MAG: hypothetical protein M1820_009022 [Bogoriella megaspora]
MAPHRRLFARSKILTNPAAEFVDTRAAPAIAAHVTGTVDETEDNPPEFVAEIDRFTLRSEVPKEPDCRESVILMLKFQETLERFCKTLQEKETNRKLGITLKNLREYTFYDVLEIAEKIQNRHKGSTRTRTAMDCIRNCFRAVAKHQNTLKSILDCLPNDIYGSLICGGFTFVLTAVCDYEEMRDNIQAALAEIPEKLSKVHVLKDVYITSSALRLCANKVLLSIFMVLERIVDKLLKGTDSWKKRAITAIRGDNPKIREALDSFAHELARLEDAARDCAHIRLGRVEEACIKMDRQVDGMSKDVKEAVQVFKDHKREVLEFRNKLYQFIGSDPRIDPRDGSVKEEYLTPSIQPSVQTTTKPLHEAAMSSPDRNRKLVETWFRRLEPFNPHATSQVEECFATVEMLDLGEKDKIQWVMSSPEVLEWLSQKSSSIIDIEAESPPDQPINSLSFVTAQLVSVLKAELDFPVLSFFCWLRSIDSREEDMSGSIAILKSWNGQLMDFILAKQTAVDLSFLDDETLSQKSQKSMSHAWKLFKTLLGLLPSDEVIFILIDSLSNLSGNSNRGDELIKATIGLALNASNIVIKFLTTDCMTDCPVKQFAHLSLRVPDHVDQGRFGLNLEVLNEENRSALAKSYRKDRKTSVASSDESGSDNWWELDDTHL